MRLERPLLDNRRGISVPTLADRFTDAVGMRRGSGRDVLAARQAETDRLAAERARTNLDASDLDALLRVLASLTPQEIAADEHLRVHLSSLPGRLHEDALRRWVQDSHIVELLLEGFDMPLKASAVRQSLKRTAVGRYDFVGLPEWARDLRSARQYADQLMLNDLARMFAGISVLDPVSLLRHSLGNDDYKALRKEFGRTATRRRLKSATLSDWTNMWAGALGANQFRDPLHPDCRMSHKHLRERARAAAYTYLMLRP